MLSHYSQPVCYNERSGDSCLFIPKNVFKFYNKYRKLCLCILMHFRSFELLEFISISFANWLEVFCPTTEKVLMRKIVDDF